MRRPHPNPVVHLELHTPDLSSADGSLGSLESKRRHHERIVEQLGETEATGKPEGSA